MRSTFGRSGPGHPCRRRSRSGAARTAAAGLGELGEDRRAGGRDGLARRPPGRTGVPARSLEDGGRRMGTGPCAVRAIPRPSSGGAGDARPAEEVEHHRRPADVHDRVHRPDLVEVQPRPGCRGSSPPPGRCARTARAARPSRAARAARIDDREDLGERARGGSSPRPPRPRGSRIADWLRLGPRASPARRGAERVLEARTITPRSSAAARNMSPAMPPMGLRTSRGRMAFLPLCSWLPEPVEGSPRAPFVGRSRPSPSRGGADATRAR
jgi:hypothetical protein